VVLRGRNGAGKSETLRAIDSLVTGRGRLRAIVSVTPNPVTSPRRAPSRTDTLPRPVTSESCKHRDGVRCTNPEAQINGGLGLKIKAGGSYAHVCRSPRSQSGWMYLGAPATECSGREEA